MSDVKKLFDSVFGAPNKIQAGDLPTEKRGIPVKLSAMDSYQIHRNLVKAYDTVLDAQKEMNRISWRLMDAKNDLKMALGELEVRINAHEQECGISGTTFRILSDRGEMEDGDTAKICDF